MLNGTVDYVYTNSDFGAIVVVVVNGGQLLIENEGLEFGAGYELIAGIP